MPSYAGTMGKEKGMWVSVCVCVCACVRAMDRYERILFHVLFSCKKNQPFPKDTILFYFRDKAEAYQTGCMKVACQTAPNRTTSVLVASSFDSIG